MDEPYTSVDGLGAALPRLRANREAPTGSNAGDGDEFRALNVALTAPYNNNRIWRVHPKDSFAVLSRDCDAKRIWGLLVSLAG